MGGDAFALRSRRVIGPAGVQPATIIVRDGRIAELAPWEVSPTAAAAVLELGDGVVMPGVIDLHVHADDPGRADWEGFATATRAAAAGGVTTFLDMPLNSVPPTTDRAGLEAKRSAAAGRLAVDVGLWGGLVPATAPPTAAGVLEDLWREGVFGFKAFLAPSGVDEFPAVGEEELRRALPLLADLGAPLLVHAELPALLDAGWGDAADVARCRSYAAYLASRPPAAEAAAIDLVTGLALEAGARIHVVHVSSAEGVEAVRRARERGAAISAETCPHYLCASAEEIPDGATAWKCAPPVRQAFHREALWQGLADGVLDLVASDHSPSPAAGKHLEEGDFARAWGGIGSLQLLLPVTWTGARRRGVPLARLAEWLSAAPARVAGLAGRKGAIEPGHDADLVVWDPEATFTVDPARLQHRHPTCPYAGRELAGVVRRTFVRGVEVFDGSAAAEPPRGRLLRR